MKGYHGCQQLSRFMKSNNEWVIKMGYQNGSWKRKKDLDGGEKHGEEEKRN